MAWVARRLLQLVEVEDCAGTARDGALDDGHALCGEFGAGLGLEGRSQAVDRAAQTPGRGLPGWHPGAGAVLVVKQERVQAERAVGDGRIDHPFGDDGEPRFLDDEGAGCAERGVRWWGSSGHGDGLSSGCAEGGQGRLDRCPPRGERVRNASGNALELYGQSGVRRPKRDDGQAGHRSQGSVRADSGTRRMRARLPTGPEDWAVRQRSPAAACRGLRPSAGPSGAPSLGDVVVARAAARDRGRLPR